MIHSRTRETSGSANFRSNGWRKSISIPHWCFLIPERHMANRKPLIDPDGEVRELTAEDLVKFRPSAEVLPSSLRKKLGVRGPQKTPTKERITIRLSREVVEQFRESGEGWQTRMDAALREWLKNHSPV